MTTPTFTPTPQTAADAAYALGVTETLDALVDGLAKVEPHSIMSAGSLIQALQTFRAEAEASWPERVVAFVR